MTLKYDPDIFDAVEFGDLESIKRYWTTSIDIDYQEKHGNTLLMLAAYYGHQKIVEYLLDFSPNLYLQNHAKKTVFEIAENLDNQEIYDLLLDHTWSKHGQMFLFEYHVCPLEASEFQGAFVNCWMMGKDFNKLKTRSQELIINEKWAIKAIENISEIRKGEIDEHADGYPYYRQAIIDKEVLVFYTYEEDDDL